MIYYTQVILAGLFIQDIRDSLIDHEGDIEMNHSHFHLKQVSVFIFIFLFFVASVQAASFDCVKSLSHIEKLICSDEALSTLDESLNEAYLKALKRTDIKTKAMKSQKQWLKNTRNICQSTECLKKAYETRIKELGLTSSYGIVIFRETQQDPSLPKTATNIPTSQTMAEPVEDIRTKSAQPQKSRIDSGNRTSAVKKLPGVSVASDQMMSRPRLMSETLYAEKYYTEPPSNALVWSKALLDLKVPGFTPRVDSASTWRNCNYMSALATLGDIQSKAGKESPYLKIWAANQDRVLLACENPSGSDKPPGRPAGKSLPRRAQGDFLYQLGSWNFYKGDYKEALMNYEQAEKMIGTPQRPYAAYMVVRTLAYLNRAEEAYHKVGKILSDPSLQRIHANAKNYRFVIMSNSRAFDLELTPKLATEHLNWLQKIVQLDTRKAQHTSQAFAEQKDALEQFNLYFPLYSPDTKTVDWWLTTDAPEGPRMQAVKTLAPKNPLIDWMQAKWAFNVFDHDWLWALHADDNPYWSQNRHIVIHAFEQWKSKKDGAWLQIAIQRVHPRDKLAQEILAAAEPFLNRLWKNETPEYRLWIFDLWANDIRIRLGRGEMDKVNALVSEHFDYYGYGLLAFPESRDYSYSRNDFKEILEKTLRWLVYTGQFEHARSFLNIVQGQFRYEFYQWRSLLAVDLDEAISVATTSHHFSSSSYGNDESVWREMLNMLPSSALHSIAVDERVKLANRAVIARTLFTRAILLNYDNDLIDKYAALAVKLNPSIREQLLESVAGHDRDKYVGFLLKMPRFRPAAYLEYADNPQIRRDDKSPAIDAIDRYNHNDNNWWCSFDDDMFKRRIFNAVKIVPLNNELLSLAADSTETNTDSDENEEADHAEKTDKAYGGELQPYLDHQKRLLDQHPYSKLIDPREIEALMNIPSGPQYLSEAVIKRELSSKAAANPGEQNDRAANLHRAVRTTRYGCKRDGEHGEYSQKAFILLHKNYENTPWAKATPYWFD